MLIKPRVSNNPAECDVAGLECLKIDVDVIELDLDPRNDGLGAGDVEAEERIRRFILANSSEILREGIEFKLDPHVETGVSVRVVDEELRIDLNNVTISEFLVRHLLPRYRRILADEYLDQ